MHIVKKAVTVETPVTDDDSAHGSFSLILSDNSTDRDGEIVDPGAFDPLPDFLSADVDHEMTVTGTVGSGVPTYVDDTKSAIRVDGTYASTDLGQTTRTLVKEKHIRTASVAFIPITKSVDTDGVTHVTKAELLNFAFTPVPSNRNAVVLASKSARRVRKVETKEGKRNSSDDQKHLQEAHDHLVEAGATCASNVTEPDSDVDDAEGKSVHARRKNLAQAKSIVGSVEALQDRCRDALEDTYTASWGLYLRGVLPEQGVLVFDYYGYSAIELESGETYRQAFTDDGAVVTLTGDPEVVDIHEIIAPDADADVEDGLKSAARPAGAAAAAPATPAADPVLDTEIRIRTLAARARAASLD